MTYRNTEREEKSKTYFITSANWEYCTKADSPQEAATLAIRDIYEMDDGMKVSPTIMVTDLSEFSESENYLENCVFCYSPKILSNAGLHNLSKDLDEIINSMQDES